jgi:hypothetical protein
MTGPSQKVATSGASWGAAKRALLAGWGAPATLVAIAAALVLLGIFIEIERRVASPIIDFKLLRHPQFLACCVMALTLGGFIAVGSFMAPLYLRTVRNELPYVAGLMVLPISSLAVIVPPVIGKLAATCYPTPRKLTRRPDTCPCQGVVR